MLEARQLEVLVAIAGAGTLSRAAQALGTDQPHVSRTLAKIENRLGYRVFDRSAAGARPTERGRDVLHQAERALAALARLERREPPAEELRVVVHGVDVVALMQRLELHCPDLDIRLSSRPESGAAFADLSGGGADVVVVARLPHVRWAQRPGLVEVEVATLRTTVLLPSSHPLAGQDAVDLADLSEETWLTSPDPQAEHSLRTECRVLAGFDPRIRHRSSHIGEVLQLVRGGCVAHGMPFRARPEIAAARPYLRGTPTSILLQHIGAPAAADASTQIVAAIRDVIEGV